jgi:hypothetical protein
MTIRRSRATSAVDIVAAPSTSTTATTSTATTLPQQQPRPASCPSPLSCSVEAMASYHPRPFGLSLCEPSLIALDLICVDQSLVKQASLLQDIKVLEQDLQRLRNCIDQKLNDIQTM